MKIRIENAENMKIDCNKYNGMLTFRSKKMKINKELESRRKKIINENESKEHHLFADFILGTGTSQFGILGFTYHKIFVYDVSEIIFESGTDLGDGSGGRFDEKINNKLKEIKGSLNLPKNREAIIELVKSEGYYNEFWEYEDWKSD